MNRPRPCPKIALSTMLLAAMLLMGCESLPLWPDQRIVPGGVGEVAVTVVENPPRHQVTLHAPHPHAVGACGHGGRSTRPY